MGKDYTINFPMDKPIDIHVNQEGGYTNSYTFIGEGLTVTDGNHTMDDLYRHRHALFAALIKAYDSYITPLSMRVRCWKSRAHADGTMYPGWFIAGMSRDKFDGSVEHLAYHLPDVWWDKFRCIELANAPEYDGYSSEDVIVRLLLL